MTAVAHRSFQVAKAKLCINFERLFPVPAWIPGRPGYSRRLRSRVFFNQPSPQPKPPRASREQVHFNKFTGACRQSIRWGRCLPSTTLPCFQQRNSWSLAAERVHTGHRWSGRSKRARVVGAEFAECVFYDAGQHRVIILPDVWICHSVFMGQNIETSRIAVSVA